MASRAGFDPRSIVWGPWLPKRWHVCDIESAIAADFISCRAENPKKSSRMFPSCSKSTKRSPGDSCRISLKDLSSRQLAKYAVTFWQLLPCHFSKVSWLSLSTHSIFDGTYFEYSYRLFVCGLLKHHRLLQRENEAAAQVF